MLFHHTQGFMQEAWFQALQLFQSHLRPDLYDDAAYFHENPHLNELVVLQALGRVHPNNEQFAREVLWLLYALEGDFLLDHPEEDHFPVTEWPVLRGSDQYRPPPHQLLCWNLKTDTGIVMHQKRFYLLDFTSCQLTPCDGVPASSTFTNTPPGTVLKGFTRQAALSAMGFAFQHFDQRFPDLRLRDRLFIHRLLDTAR